MLRRTRRRARRAEALAELDRAKTTFFSNVSHEFRTPLTLMLGPLEDELAETAAPLPPARRQRLETAHRNSLRLLKLVNTLLDFSRIEAGRTHARFEPTDLAALHHGAGQRVSVGHREGEPHLDGRLSAAAPGSSLSTVTCGKRSCSICCRTPSSTPSAVASPCACAELGDNVVLSITDTGVGIPAAELPRVFERFHRVKGAASRSHEGTGIGLALVRELVRAHHGEIEVRSEEGSGSTFTVCIPVGNARSHRGSGKRRQPAVERNRPAERARVRGGGCALGRGARSGAGGGPASGGGMAIGWTGHQQRLRRAAPRTRRPDRRSRVLVGR